MFCEKGFLENFAKFTGKHRHSCFPVNFAKFLRAPFLTHGRRVNFERGCRINGQKGTYVEHPFQNNNIQKIFLSVILYLNVYIFIYIVL